MKNTLAIIGIVLMMGALFASCTSYKQSCAAYNEVETDTQSE